MASKPKILVVDDEKPNCDLYYEILTGEELYSVDLAYNGIEALRKVADNPYDVIISDITMPELDGISFLKKVKEKNSDVEVIMISGLGTLDTAVESFRSQAFDFLTKPVEIDKLLSTVKSALSKKELQEAVLSLQSRLPYATTNSDLLLGYVLINREGILLDADRRLLPNFTKVSRPNIRQIGTLSFLAEDLIGSAQEGDPIVRRWAVLGLRENLRILCFNTICLTDWMDGPAGLAAVVDVTRIKRQEREMRDRERLSALSEMTTVVSTKLGTLLSAITQGNENILAEVQNLQASHRPNISGIITNTQAHYMQIRTSLGQVRSLMGTLEDFSQQFVPQYSGVDLNEIVKQATDPLFRDLPQGVNAGLDLSKTLPKISGSRKDLKQVFTNLVENAIKAVGGGGEILIQSGEHNGLVTVIVGDNGPGIPWEEQEKIFDAFYSNWGPTSSSKGLGLAIARKIVEDHDGMITVESQKGLGAIFTVTLPSSA